MGPVRSELKFVRVRIRKCGPHAGSGGVMPSGCAGRDPKRPAERQAWIAAAGSGVPVGGSELVLQQADVAGHVLTTFGLTPTSSDFVGLPFGTRKNLAL